MPILSETDANLGCHGGGGGGGGGDVCFRNGIYHLQLVVNTTRQLCHFWPRVTS